VKKSELISLIKQVIKDISDEKELLYDNKPILDQKISKNKLSVKESVDDLVYSNEIVESDPSIDSLIELYADDYIDYIDRGSVKFFDYGNTFKLSFNLKFPKKKVEFKSLNIIYQSVSKALNFFKKSTPYGKGEVSKIGENDNNFILKFVVRGGK